MCWCPSERCGPLSLGRGNKGAKCKLGLAAHSWVRSMALYTPCIWDPGYWLSSGDTKQWRRPLWTMIRTSLTRMTSSYFPSSTRKMVSLFLLSCIPKNTFLIMAAWKREIVLPSWCPSGSLILLATWEDIETAESRTRDKVVQTSPSPDTITILTCILFQSPFPFQAHPNHSHPNLYFDINLIINFHLKWQVKLSRTSSDVLHKPT